MAGDILRNNERRALYRIVCDDPSLRPETSYRALKLDTIVLRTITLHGVDLYPGMFKGRKSLELDACRNHYFVLARRQSYEGALFAVTAICFANQLNLDQLPVSAEPRAN
jgi:hypothetical protein